MMDETIAILKRDEGFRSKIYNDSLGNPTVGWGFTYLTEPEANKILVGRVDTLADKLQHALPVYHELDDVRQSVLICIAYNAGLEGLMSFRQMLSCLENKDWNGAEKELLSSEYARQVGNRAQRYGLMLSTGKWPQ